MSGKEATLRVSIDSQRSPAVQAFEFLAANKASPACIDLDGLESLDVPLVQVLIAAARQWAADGIGLRITGVSEKLRAGLLAIGVTPDKLETEPAP